MRTTDSNLFTIPDRLPEAAGEVQMYRATAVRSLSSRDRTHQAAFEKRIRQATQLFDMSGEPADKGERVLFMNLPRTLELYRASDSLWWTNHSIANVDFAKGDVRLPAESQATEMAKRELERSELDVTDASVASVSYVEASAAESGRSHRTTNTGVDVNYRFSLSGLPVFGPGAKIKVSLGHEGQLAQMIYFWRRPEPGKSVPTIAAQDAMERFQRDPAFFRLRQTGASVEVNTVTFGYYAMSPGDFQRLYFPVYAVEGTVRTRDLPRYDFRRYVVAVDISPEEAKRMGVVANPAACRVF